MPGQRERRRRLDAVRGWCCWAGTAACASGPSRSSLATPLRWLRVRQVDEIISRIRDSVHPEANIIFGSTFDQTMKDRLRVSVIITGLSKPKPAPVAPNISAAALRTPATQPFTPPTAYEVWLPLPCSRPLQGPAPFFLSFSNPVPCCSRSPGPRALRPDSVRRRCRRGKSRSRPAAVRCRGGRRPTTAATGLGPTPQVQSRPRVAPTAAAPRQTRCWSRSSRHSGGTGDAGSVPFLFL